MPGLRISNLGSTVSIGQFAGLGAQMNVTTSANSATQDVTSTSGWAINEYLAFKNAAGTVTIRQIQSITDANTVVLTGAIDTSSGGPWTVRRCNQNDCYGFAMMFHLDEEMEVDAIALNGATIMSTGESIAFNLSIFSNVINTNDWNPNAIISANAWGTVTVSRPAAATGSNRYWPATLQSRVVVPAGYGWVCGTMQPTIAGTTNAGSFEAISIARGEAVNADGTVGYSRYDLETTAAVAYAATTPSAAFSGKSWIDSGSNGLNRPQNMNFAFMGPD